MTDRDVDLTAPLGSTGDGAGIDPMVDWRFLLPDAHLGIVAVDGPTHPRLRAALVGCATSVHHLDDEDRTAYDTILLTAPSRSRARTAVQRLGPVGTIRIERVTVRRRRLLATELRDAGFEVRTWWARPSSTAAWCLVSLDDPAAAATVVRTVAGRGRRATHEAWLARTGLAGRQGRDVSLLAQRGDGDTERHAVAAAGPGEVLAGLVTPRYAASKAVVGVTVHGRTLLRVAKLARSPEADHHIRAEAAALDAFVGAAPTAGAPGRHRLAHHAGRPVLVEDAAPGRPLDRRAVRRDPAAALSQGLAWLASAPTGPTAPLRADGRAFELLREPLRAIAGLASTDVAEHRSRVRRAARALEPLADASLPVTFEHGDLGHPNLFAAPDGTLVAIDWERARPDGLPLHDLTFYLAFLAESIDRPRTHHELVASYRRACHHGGWARPDVERHAERAGVDQRLIPLLELACWTRTLARLAEPGIAGRSVDDHRHGALWVAAIERAEERRR